MHVYHTFYAPPEIYNQRVILILPINKTEGLNSNEYADYKRYKLKIKEKSLTEAYRR